MGWWGEVGRTVHAGWTATAQAAFGHEYGHMYRHAYLHVLAICQGTQHGSDLSRWWLMSPWYRRTVAVFCALIILVKLTYWRQALIETAAPTGTRSWRHAVGDCR